MRLVYMVDVLYISTVRLRDDKPHYEENQSTNRR